MSEHIYHDKLRKRCAAQIEQFAQCSLPGLRDLFDAFTLAVDAMQGPYNRPRFDVDAAEGDFLLNEMSRLHDLRAALVMHADERLLTDSEDFDAYRDIVTRYESDCGSGTAEWFRLLRKIEQRQASVPKHTTTADYGQPEYVQ